MLKINQPLRIVFLVACAALFTAACTKTPTIQGSPPLSSIPDKVNAFAGPYVSSIVTPGVVGAAILVGPNFLPGRCDGLFLTGDRRLICEQMARFNEPEFPVAKIDPNARYRCIRTLGGVTECTEAPALSTTPVKAAP
jgi:hypothetical protein